MRLALLDFPKFLKTHLYFQADKYLCGPKSLYDQMFGIYNLAVATLVKGYTMIGYAYNIRRQRLSDPSMYSVNKNDFFYNFRRDLQNLFH